jgi:hypothetical protein
MCIPAAFRDLLRRFVHVGLPGRVVRFVQTNPAQAPDQRRSACQLGPSADEPPVFIKARNRLVDLQILTRERDYSVALAGSLS